MDTNILINIPHSSLKVPSFFKERLLIDEDEFKQELELLADLYTDDLFKHNKCHIVQAQLSRLFCDVERFRNDEDESMSKKGMGAVYTKTSQGKNLISVTQDYKDFVLKNYYDRYHSSLVTKKYIYIRRI